ncbi:MAG: hypothetical protein HY509_00750 [Acidobacteria bacterium]|nr:hypothetical protein [Acidobacteriota bacterium]
MRSIGEAQADLEKAIRMDFLEKYPEHGYERRPTTRLFGIRVVVGDPKVGEEFLPPEPGGP